MTAENIIAGIVILGICGLQFIVLGIFQIKSKEPAGFWSGVKPPSRDEISDVTAYNKKHGMMWIIYGLGTFPAFFFGMFLGGIAVAALLGIEIIGGLVVMICYHNYLNKKYVK